jgi:hypothetical protein
MSKTTNAKQCEILASFWAENGENQEYSQVVEHFRLGFAAAFLTNAGATTLTEFGQQAVDQTWESLLMVLGIEDQSFPSYEAFQDLFKKQ